MSENMIRYVNEAASGNTDALAKLYSKTLKSSCFLAARLCIDPDLSKEVTEKAYARAFCNIGKLKKPEAFEIWMKQNVALAFKEAVSLRVSEYKGECEASAPEFLPESVLQDEYTVSIISDAVDALETEERAVVLLHYNNGMPVSGLARFLETNENTINFILTQAREKILAACGCEKYQGDSAMSMPVLTRIFQQLSVKTTVDNSSVRDIFIYAIDAYKSENPTVGESGNAGVAPAASAEKTQPDIGSFKSRIDDILSGNPSNVPDKSDVKENDKNSLATAVTVGENGVDVPTFKSSREFTELSDADPEGIDLKSPELDLRSKSKIDFSVLKKYFKNKKLVAICAGVLLVIVIVIIAVAAGGKDSGENKANNNNINSTDSSSSESVTNSKKNDELPSYSWVAGGFEQCADITYLDENCLYFRSVENEKYGLMDYQGNIILEPLYDGFVRCGYGRDYSGRDSYHSLVNIDGTKYEFAIDQSGNVTINETPHGSHTLEGDDLGNTSYDERDRYFEGYAAARKDGKWGYVSQEKDKKVIPYEYEEVNNLKSWEAASCDYCRGVTGGLIAVKKDGRMGIINLDNKTVVPFEYSNIMPGDNGVFIACKNDTWGVILVGDAVTSFSGINIDLSNISSELPISTNNEIGRFVTIEGGANIRSGPDIDYEEVGEIAEYIEVAGYAKKTNEVTGKDWIYVNYKGVKGWVAMSRLNKVE